MMGLLILGVVVIVGIAAVVMAVESEKKKSMAKYVEALPGFAAQFMWIGSDGVSGLAIDDSAKQLCLVTSAGSNFVHRVVPYSSLISSELREDGYAVSSASRTSQVAGAVVGGALLGGVGAAVGALSGGRKESGRVTRVELRLTIEDIALPVHTVAFQSVEAARNGIIHTHAAEQAREWQARIEAVIRQAERNSEAAAIAGAGA